MPLGGKEKTPGSFAVSIEIDQDVNLARVDCVCCCFVRHAMDRNEFVRTPLRSRAAAAATKIKKNAMPCSQGGRAATGSRRGEVGSTHLHLNIPLCPVSLHHLGGGGEREVRVKEAVAVVHHAKDVGEIWSKSMDDGAIITPIP